MGVLSRVNVAVFTVPLVLSSLLLRALQGLHRFGRRRKRRPAGRRSAKDGPGTSRQAASGRPRSRPSSEDVRSMRRELSAVLDGHDGSREVFRYLAHFEQRFGRSGLRILEDMPTKRLRRALAQFEAIVSNWSSPHLADLRSRMAVAVADRDSGAAMWAPQQTISKAYGPREMPMLARRAGQGTGFRASRQVEVDDDIAISRFEAAMGEWNAAAQPAAPAV
jgi:hypothetical protein